MSDDMMEQLAAALDGHEVTDQEGYVDERETSALESAPEEQTLDDETATGENQADSEDETSTHEAHTDSEQELAEDDSGKRYVPENRFKDVYAKWKETERQLAEQQAALQQGKQLLEKRSGSRAKTQAVAAKSTAELKVEALELKTELPQFDPKLDPITGKPTNADYDPALDDLGYEIYRANPDITLLEAGRRAIRIAAGLGRKEASVRQEARQVKQLNSDQGITSRVTARIQQSKNQSEMTLAEMEDYLKESGDWNKK